MAYPDNIKQRAIELSESASAAWALKKLQKEFPETYMLNERTIRRWRKAKPIISKPLQTHFRELGNIVDFLWSEGLHRVVAKDTKRGDQFDIFEYVFEEGGQAFTRENLSKMVFTTWDYAGAAYGSWKLECLLWHIKAERPDIESKGFADFVKENPYQFVETLGVLVRRKTLEGTCPICKEWQ